MCAMKPIAFLCLFFSHVSRVTNHFVNILEFLKVDDEATILSQWGNSHSLSENAIFGTFISWTQAGQEFDNLLLFSLFIEYGFISCDRVIIIEFSPKPSRTSKCSLSDCHRTDMRKKNRKHHKFETFLDRPNLSWRVPHNSFVVSSHIVVAAIEGSILFVSHVVTIVSCIQF